MGLLAKNKILLLLDVRASFEIKLKFVAPLRNGLFTEWRSKIVNRMLQRRKFLRKKLKLKPI